MFGWDCAFRPWEPSVMSSMYSSTMIFGRRPGNAWTSLAILAAASIFANQTAAAQQAQAANSPSASTTSAKKSPSHRTRAAEVQPPAPADPPALTAPLPEPPQWPVNETPAKAAVTWDATGLKIQANNSSLHDILNEVSTDTGAKVEGMATDERVFGEYGPGTARDVLSQLLHGSSYNVLMIGDQGAGTPRQIVLSARRSGPAQSQANRAPQDQPDEDVPEPEVDEQPPMPPPMVNGRPAIPQVMQQGPPGAPRTPQQVLQELQQRQQQIQDQQNQQQQPH